MLCECGCGQPTKIAHYSSEWYGYVKGQPIRFVQGHKNSLARRNRLAAGGPMTTYDRLLLQNQVRRFLGTIAHSGNELRFDGIVFLVHQLWPNFNPNGIGCMLGRNVEKAFSYDGKVLRANGPLPWYWKLGEADLLKIKRLVADTERAMLVHQEQMRLLREKKQAEWGAKWRAENRDYLRQYQKAYRQEHTSVRVPVVPVKDAGQLLREEFYHGQQNFITQLAFSIASSRESMIAESIGPIWEGVDDAVRSGLTDEREIRKHAAKFFDRHLAETLPAWRTRSLDAMKDEWRYEPAATSGQAE